MFFKKKIKTKLNNEQNFPVPVENNLSKYFQQSEEKKQFFLSTIRTLLFLIKDFTVNSKELYSDEFKKKLDKLDKIYASENNIKILQSTFDRYGEKILSFSGRQKKYLKEREDEFIEIIDILTNGMISSQNRHQDFDKQMYGQSEKIEKIILLDDIKKIKDAVQNEIYKIRNTIWEKQEYEKKQIKKLSEQVESLTAEIKKKENGSFRDSLTGLYDRQACDMYLRNIIQKNEVRKAPFLLSIVHISSYDDVINTFGTQFGDKVMLAVTQEFGSIMTGEDFFARYGEKELAIILPQVSLRHARKKITQTLKVFSSKRYSVSDTQSMNAPSFLIILNIGLSIYKKGDTVNSVTARALKAVKIAKQSGQNNIIVEK